MQILDNIVKEIRRKSDLKQSTNTDEVIQWFESIKNRPRLSFIVFDIESFYPSITPSLLDKALEWAVNFVDVTPQQKTIIHQASQSFLFNEESPCRDGILCERHEHGRGRILADCGRICVSPGKSVGSN